MKKNNYNPIHYQENSQWSRNLLLVLALSLFSFGTLMAQVRGVVKNENGEAFQGVNVTIKGANKGTITDASGRFELAATQENTLVFSFLGYKPTERKVGNQREINVSLEVDESLMEEVVVVGYGTQKKTSLTGAVSSITNKDLVTQPVISATQAMQGRVAGVQVVNSSSPGTEPQVRVRGISSISISSDPLYVIDGIPGGALNTIAPNDIESIEVLKDASAAAIYGSRASNGVILITTKKGKAGKLNITLDSYVGTQQAWKKLDLLKAADFINYGKAMAASAATPISIPRFSNLDQPVYPGATQTFAQTDNDWQDIMFQNAPINNTQLGLSGGTDKSKFYLSLGSFNQEGIIPFTEYRRKSIRLNTDHNLNKFISVGQTLMFTNDSRIGEGQVGGRSLIMNIIRMSPIHPTEDPTKLGGYSSPSNSFDGTDPVNPLSITNIVQKNANNNTYKLLGSIFTDVKLTNWLKYRFSLGVDYSSNIARTFTPIYFDGNNGNPNTATIAQQRGRYFSSVITNQLTFDKTFDKHYINATAVAEKQDAEFSGINLSGQRPDNNIQEIQGAANLAGTTNTTANSLISYIGRLNYEFGGKYLLSGSVRRDGSSKFAPGNKWGTFPSVSAGWRISEESFMKDLKAVSELKLRASYGVTGNNSLGDYAWQPLIQANNTNYSFGNGSQLGSYFNGLGNTGLRWEETITKNIGVDLSLFNNKITFTTELFERKTDGLLLSVPLPQSLGYSNSPLANVGSLQNRGIEISLGYRLDAGELKSTISGSFDLIRNKVLSLATPNATINGGGGQDFGGDSWRTEAGQAFRSFYGWKVAGIFQSADEIAAANGSDGDIKTPYQFEFTKPGDIKFADLNGDGKIDANDRTYLGSYLPKFNYGLNYGGTYKNFDFQVFFQGVYGNKIFNGTKYLGQGMLRFFNATTDVLDAWTPNNTDTDVPRIATGDPNQNARISDRFIVDGSYLRLKNLSIGYTLPSNKLSKMTNNILTKARIYVTSQNLLTITKYTGYDPEINNGIDTGNFPQARTLTVGINLGLN
ncbi:MULTISPECIES: TonB-dependent receptor [Emticicia]|uniref:SusC/RagA family TonB-linked outer membrane protein n=1 Tax=Emticicia TaxID=312278 RepID=UPI0007D8989D|nr:MULTISPECIES: TonB-dependent receptor [Emticicia]